MTKKTKLEEKLEDWRAKGKKDNAITWGMLCDGYQHLPGIPDDFYSAEDPADRGKLWHKYQMENNETYRREQCRRDGICWRCGRTSCGCD